MNENNNPFIRRFGIVIPPSWPPGGGNHGNHKEHKKNHKEPNSTSDSEIMGAGIGTILVLLPFLI